MPVILDDPPAIGDVTVRSLVGEVYRHLEASSFGVLNQLAGDITDAATTLTVERDNQKAIRPGAILCIDIEVMYVWDFDETSKTATVQRGHLGSVAVAHTQGALIQIQPRCSQFDVLTQIIHDIRSWPPDLYQVGVFPIGIGSTTRGYDLSPSDFIRVLEVRGRSTNSTGSVYRGVKGWRVDDHADTTLYPSGRAIILSSATPATNVEVVYARAFNTDGLDLDTLLSTIGLSDSMKDIPVLGAASRLVREAPRTDTQAQGQSRRSEEVPPMHSANERTRLKRERDTRIHDEIKRLRENHPQRRQ